MARRLLILAGLVVMAGSLAAARLLTGAVSPERQVDVCWLLGVFGAAVAGMLFRLADDYRRG